jgi:hypothetical protein
MSTGYESNLLPELWVQILGSLKVEMAEDAIARARCRTVCKAWLALDPAFVVPLAPGLNPLVRLSVFGGYAEARAVFSRILAHLVPVLCGFCVSSMYIWRGYEMQFIIESPAGHIMRLFTDWPGMTPSFTYRDDQGRPRLFSTMDWKVDGAYEWRQLGPCITRCVSKYTSEEWRYPKVSPVPRSVRFHVSDYPK